MSCPRAWGCRCRRLQVPDIRAEVLGRGLVASISGSTIWRWLDEDAIRPWRHRSWIFPRDPDFAAKAGRVLDLYAGELGGPAAAARRVRPQRRREDEHPGARPLPPRRSPPRPGRAMRVEHEYERGGALAYLAAWDVHRGAALRALRADDRHRARSAGWSTR